MNVEVGTLTVVFKGILAQGIDAQTFEEIALAYQRYVADKPIYSGDDPVFDDDVFSVSVESSVSMGEVDL